MTNVVEELKKVEDAEVDDSLEASVKRSVDWWDITAAVLLSLATVLSAWSGYQSSRWNGHASTMNREASVIRSDAARAASEADRQLVIDVAVFGDWVNAHIDGNETRAAFLRQRFRSEFVPAFEDWLGDATDLGMELPQGTPFESAMFISAAQAQADRLLDMAGEAQLEADDASRTGENYVLTAVLFASVLFFAGIASKLSSQTASHLAVTLSGLSLAGAVIMLMTLSIRLGY